MNILLFFFKHSKKAILLSAVAGIISGVSNAALLAVINSSLKSGRPAATLLWMFCGLCVVLPFARFISELLLTKLGQKTMYTLRMKLCQQILAAPLQHLELLGVSRILATLTEDIPTITVALGMLPVICINFALIIGCLAYMAYLSWIFFGVLIAFLVLGIAGYQISVMKVHKIFTRARANADELLEHLRALIYGTKELKMHRGRRELFMQQQLDTSAQSFMGNNISAFRLYSVAACWGQALMFIVIGIYLFILSPMQHVSNATLIGYTLALLYLTTPIQVIMNVLPQLSRANIAMQTVTKMGFTLESIRPEELPDTAPAWGAWQTLELKCVTHRYQRENDSESFVLGPIDLTLEAGGIIFITGGNGSGKTTLMKLIAGLYLPEQGQIELNRQPVTNASVENYRQYFSAIFSDYFLFDQLLVTDSNTDKQAAHYLEVLMLSHKVQIKNGKLSTKGLSQGQRKRLALLSAYMEDRSIYLFDEWAADQDPYYKTIFYSQLLPELKKRNKTVIVISHDDRYYDVADRLIKLEEGQIVSDSGRS
jgi:putative pyoverdin transport system ATP-binding/permease protein